MTKRQMRASAPMKLRYRLNGKQNPRASRRLQTDPQPIQPPPKLSIQELAKKAAEAGAAWGAIHLAKYRQRAAEAPNKDVPENPSSSKTVEDKATATSLKEPASARPRHVHSEREIQVCLKSLDRPSGFVRSVTAQNAQLVPALRKELWNLKARSKSMSYDSVIYALKELRKRFAAGGGKYHLRVESCEANLPVLSSGGEPQQKSSSSSISSLRTVQDSNPSAPALTKLQDSLDTKSPKERKIRRRLASSARAIALKQQRKGLFAPKRLSPQLGSLLRKKRLSWTEVMRDVWKYIKKKKLQDGAMIYPDVALKQVCNNEESLHQMRLAFHLKSHLL